MWRKLGMHVTFEAPYTCQMSGSDLDSLRLHFLPLLLGPTFCPDLKSIEDEQVSRQIF